MQLRRLLGLYLGLASQPLSRFSLAVSPLGSHLVRVRGRVATTIARVAGGTKTYGPVRECGSVGSCNSSNTSSRRRGTAMDSVGREKHHLFVLPSQDDEVYRLILSLISCSAIDHSRWSPALPLSTVHDRRPLGCCRLLNAAAATSCNCHRSLTDTSSPFSFIAPTALMFNCLLDSAAVVSARHRFRGDGDARA